MDFNVSNRTNQWELKANTRNRRQARENACDQVTIGFGFASDWLSRWRQFFLSQSQSVAESKTKEMQSQITNQRDY